VEVDARNRIVREQGARPDLEPVPGQPLKTHIDLDLQRFVYNIFGDSLIGAAVVIDPKTGGVLALHTAPAIDPNRWIGGISPAYYDSLRTDTVGGRAPLYNKALQGSYPPGSTFKLATAAIALRDSIVRWDETFPQACGGSYFYGNRAWKCWKPEGHGRMALAQAIAASCDVYFYQLGLKMTLERLTAGGISLGFSRRSGIDLPGEKRPDYPTEPVAAYMDAKWGKGKWSRGITLNLAIGQGENSQTILNMARFYAAMASDGAEPRLQIVQGKPERQQVMNLPPNELERLREAMLGVITSGTAAASAIEGVAWGGKTGTAQSGRWVNGEELDHAWFAGMAPISKTEEPKIVVVVMIEYGGHGTRAAAIASKIVSHYLKVKTTWQLGDQG
jgi:penicillin-binding protein 2